MENVITIPGFTATIGAAIAFAVCIFLYRMLIKDERVQGYLKIKGKISYTLLLMCLSVGFGVFEIVVELVYLLLFDIPLIANNIAVAAVKIIIFPMIIYAIGIFIPNHINKTKKDFYKDKGITTTNSLSTIDESLWQHASNELASDSRREGLWSKCFALADGDEAKAKALYLRERVTELSKQTQPLEQNKSIGPELPIETKSKNGLLLILLLFFPLLLIWLLVSMSTSPVKDAAREYTPEELGIIRKTPGTRSEDDLDELARRYGGVPVTPSGSQFGGIPVAPSRDEFGGVLVEKNRNSKEVPKEDLPWNLYRK